MAPFFSVDGQCVDLVRTPIRLHRVRQSLDVVPDLDDKGEKARASFRLDAI